MRRRQLTSSGGIVLVSLVAVNLRWPLLSPSPMLEEMRVGLGLGRDVVSLISALPLVAFGLAAPLGAWLGRRLGNDRTLILALLAVGLATVVRSLGDRYIVLAGAALLGMAIAVGNVIAPALVKRDFPGRVALVTSVYTASLTAGGALGSASAAGLAQLGWSWPAAIAMSAPLAVVTALILVRRRPSVPGSVASAPARQTRLASGAWRNRQSWLMAVYFSCQCLLFFSVATWLPTILQANGTSLVAAGNLLSLFTVLGIPGAMAVPRALSSAARRRLGAATAGVAWTIAVAGLAIWPDGALLWVAIAGFAQGAGISFTFALIALLCSDDDEAREMGGVVQSAAYLVAALGPVALGVGREVAGSWPAPLSTLIVVGAVMAGAGLRAGSEVTVRAVR